MRLLSYCGMLAAGEFLASFVPSFAETWPVAALALPVVVLFGYGLGVRGWSHVAGFLLGVMLFLLASTVEERKYRECPWMRGREWRTRQEAADPGVRRMLKGGLSQRMAIGLSGKDEALCLGRAILLGERSHLPYRLKRTFVESGAMHVFAISGLHVMAIAHVLTLALSLLLVPRRLAGVFASPLLWAYVYLTGCSPSAVRAAIMMTFHSAAPLFWRRPDLLRAWILTFLLVHVCNPLLIVNVGNALSFLVMLAIVLAGEAGRDLPEWKQGLLVTFAAWAVGVPISAHVFGRVTPGGLVANLLLIGVAKVTVYMGALGVMTSYVSGMLAGYFNNLCALAIRAMVFVAEAVARLPGANVETGPWSLPVCAGWYAALVALAAWFACRMRRRRLL